MENKNEELIRKRDAIDAMLGDKVQITDTIRALGGERDFEVLNCTCDRHAEIIKALPSAQPVNDDLIQKIEEGIKATTPTDEYMVGMRNGMRWCKSLLDGKEPEYDTVQSNHDAEPGKMVDDTISRKAAIDALHMHLMYRMGTDSNKKRLDEWINNLPSAQPEIIRCKECEHWDTSWQNDYAPNYHYCPLVDGTRRDDFYCADAERRTDE